MYSGIVSSTLAALAGASVLTLAGPVQAPALETDSPDVRSHIETARKAAGDQWAEAFAFFCAPNQKAANRADDPVITPTEIFDGVYAIGRSTTIVYAIKTSAGIVLIDSGYQNDIEPVLIAGMRALKLDPAAIKDVLVTHAHADHFGGAKYLQDQYGARIWLTAADWDVLERPAQPGRGGQAVPAPKRDKVIVERQPITLGDETLTPVYLPGHTPGTIALIFPVKDRGKAHVAGLLGAPMLIPPPDPQVAQHIQSLAHFGQIAKDMKVDVELLNHPMMDGASDKFARLLTRTPGGPNPFVVGADGYQRFLTVSSECLKSVLARRADSKTNSN